MVGSRPAISLIPIFIQQLAENSQSVVPTKKDYAMATVKEVLTLAQSAASVIPVPFLEEAIGVALKIIQLCEVRRISPLKVARRLIKLFIRKHQIVKELQVKVGDLMIVIVDHVTPKDKEDSKATVVKTAEGVEQDIKELLRCGLRILVSYGF